VKGDKLGDGIIFGLMLLTASLAAAMTIYNIFGGK